MTSLHYARRADKFYESAPFYSTTESNHARLVKLVVDTLCLRPHDTLADIGAGNGTFTSSLVEWVGSQGATIVEPSKEFMAGSEKHPLITAINMSVEEWTSGKCDGKFDRILLKEVVHHLGCSAERQASLKALRSRRLATAGRLLIVTRHQSQPDIPLFEAARRVWAENQPTGAEIAADLRQAGFSCVRVAEATLQYTMPLNDWCSLVRRRVWSTFSHFSDREIDEGIDEIRRAVASEDVCIGDRLVLISADQPLVVAPPSSSSAPFMRQMSSSSSGPQSTSGPISAQTPSLSSSYISDPSPSSSNDSRGLSYESGTLLHEYLLLHFGAEADMLPFDSTVRPVGPREALRFPQRCAELAVECNRQLKLPTQSALDIGCAVGGSCFELAKTFHRVVGIDRSQSFVSAAQTMAAEGQHAFLLRDQGELVDRRIAKLEAGSEATAGRVVFEVGDACALTPELGTFDVVLMANLLCRLPDPQACLSQLSNPRGLVRPGGLAVIISPYTWMVEHTPRELWLGGYSNSDGGRVYSNDTLVHLLSPEFTLLREEEMPLLIREHKRKYQYIVSHAMVFRRRAT